MLLMNGLVGDFTFAARKATTVEAINEESKAGLYVEGEVRARKINQTATR